MADWWKSAPVAKGGQNWWAAAPEERAASGPGPDTPARVDLPQEPAAVPNVAMVREQRQTAKPVEPGPVMPMPQPMPAILQAMTGPSGPAPSLPPAALAVPAMPAAAAAMPALPGEMAAPAPADMSRMQSDLTALMAPARPGTDPYQPDVPFDPRAIPQPQPFEAIARAMEYGPQPAPPPQQGLGDLGRRAARGAVEIGASLPEAAAIAGAGNPNASPLMAAETVQRAQEQIAAAEQRIADVPNMSREARARIDAVIEESRRTIAAYQPLVDLAEGPLRPAADQRPLYQRGAAIRQAGLDLFGTPDPQFDDRFVSKLAEGAGSMAGFVGATLLTGPLGGAATGSAMNTAGMYRRAKQDGATEEQARTAAYIGAMVGASEVVPIAGAFRMLPSPLRAKASQAMGKRLANAFATAGEEGVQEALTEIANNLTAKGIYDPEQGVFEGAGESALIGAILGGGMGVVAGGAEDRRVGPANFPPVPGPRDREPRRDTAPMAAPPAAPPPPVADQAPAAPAMPADPAQAAQQAPAGPVQPAAADTRPQSPAAMPQAPTAPAAPAVPAAVDPQPLRPQPPAAPADTIPQIPESAPDQGAGQGGSGNASVGSGARPAQEPAPPLASDSIQPGADVEVSLAGGPLIRGRIGRVTRDGPVLIEDDGTETVIPVEDIDDGETSIFAAGTAPEEFRNRGIEDEDAPEPMPAAPAAPPPAAAPAPAPQAAAPSPAQGEGRDPLPDLPDVPGRTRKFLTHDETLSIQTDPKAFQYKAGGDTEGVTDRLQGVTNFDPERAGQAILYRRRDGRLIVADGHQRTGLARRAAAAGQQDVGGMAATIYDEAEGYTPGDVMTLAALKNISEGSGTAVDAARILRNRPETVEQLGLPPRSALVRDAAGLRNLSDDAFGMVANGAASERDGAAVGRVVADKALHANILSLLKRLNPATASQAEMIARDASRDTTDTETADLFGSQSDSQTLYLERARVLDSAMKALKADKALFSRLVRDSGTIQGAGNQLDTDTNAARADQDARVLEYLTRQANMKGPISDALTAAARALSTGSEPTAAAAARRFTEDAKRALYPDGEGGGAVGGASPQREAAPQPEPEADRAEVTGGSLFPDTPQPQRGMTDRQRAEMAARQQQSKVRRLDGNTGDGGPLFDTQGDLLGQAPKAEPARARAAPADPERFPDIASLPPYRFGPGAQIVPRPIASGKALYRETSPEALADLFRADGELRRETMSVADNRDIAPGQSKDTGVMVTFRPDSLSGEEIRKPGTGAIAGREYQVDLIGPRAVERLEIPNKLLKRVGGVAQRVLAREFDRTSRDGVAVFTRRLEAPQSTREQRPAMGRSLATPDVVEAMLPRLRAELDRMNLKRVRIGLDDPAADRQGVMTANELGDIDILIGKALNPEATLYHEAMHAMRVMDLFTAQEWAAMEREAVKSWLGRYNIERRYPDLTRDEQIEEAIAEAFSDHVRRKESPKGSILVRAFNKIARLLRALRNALTGAGFQTAEDVFGKALAGEIAARDAGSTGAVAREQRFAPSPQDEGGSFSADAMAKHKALTQQYGGTGVPTQMGLPSPFMAPERRKIDWLRETFQDRFIMFRAAEAAIESQTGTVLPESMSFSLKETLFRGRTAARLERLMQEEIKPLTDAIARSRVSLDDLGMYLIAKHAPERNALMAKRDPKRFAQGGGSGMTDAHAAEVIKEMQDKGIIKELDRLAGMVKIVLRRDLLARRAAGLLSEAEFRSFSSMYENYVPLRGFAEREEGGQLGTGSGFDIRGRESRNALGRTTLSDNPVVQAIAMRQAGIVRAEKNRAGRALMRLVQRYPNPDLWEPMGKLPMRKVLDPDTGMVKEIVDFGATREDEVLAVKIDGTTRYLRIKDPIMAEAVKNLDLRNQSVLAKVLGFVSRFTRGFSRLQTGANPDFVFPNGMSDFLEGIWTAYNVTDAKKMARSYSKNYPLALLQGIRSEFKDSYFGQKLSDAGMKRLKRLTGEDVTEDTLKRFEAYQKEWEATGGKISFMAFRDLDEITRDINREIEKTGRRVWQVKPWETVESMLAAIEKVNQPVESAGRLAMYVAARENGLSKEKAAALSLDASGNYFRNGRATRGLAALYAFFNPAVQGIEKFMRFSTKPRNWAVMGGVVATGYVMTELMIRAFEDDEDPEKRSLYLDIPEWERARSIIIPTGVTEVEVDSFDANNAPIKEMVKRLDYISIRIPHNLRPLLVMGAKASELSHGATKPEDAAKDISKSILSSFNPLGSDSPMNAVAPTVLDPFVDLALNRTFSGSPIHPEQMPWTEGLPESSQYFERSTAPVFTETAQLLNRATGGDRFNPGFADVYPDEIEYLFDYLTGGLGRFISRSAEAAQNAIQGVETDPGRVPVLRSFMGQSSEYAQGDRYYRLRGEEMEGKNLINSARRALKRNPEDKEAQAALTELMRKMNVSMKGENFVWTESTVRIFENADKQLKPIREEMVAIINDDSISRPERLKQLKQKRLQIELIQRDARRDFVTLQNAISAATGPE